MTIRSQVKGEIGLIFMQDLPKHGPDLNSSKSHNINQHVFLKNQAYLEPSVGTTKLIKSEGLHPGDFPFTIPRHLQLSGECVLKTSPLSLYKALSVLLRSPTSA